jgi:hypothetical protein
MASGTDLDRDKGHFLYLDIYGLRLSSKDECGSGLASGNQGTKAYKADFPVVW